MYMVLFVETDLSRPGVGRRGIRHHTEALPTCTPSPIPGRDKSAPTF